MTHPRRFSGLDRLYGADTVAQLAAAHVCVVGVGGVGSWAVEALARCGVGHLTLIDADHVAESNINRQIQATSDTLGAAKIEALRARIALIHPECVVDVIDNFIDEHNLSLIPAAAHVVLDCTDQVRAKFAMWQHCQRRAQPILLCGAAGGKRDATQVVIGDLAHSIQDPILAKVRQRVRKAQAVRHNPSRAQASKKITKLNIPVLYSPQAMRYPNQSDTHNTPDPSIQGGLNCAGFGSSVMVTASFGMAAAQWALERIVPHSPR